MEIFFRKKHGIEYLNFLLKLHRKQNSGGSNFQTLHRIVPTNEYLFKLNILNSSSCIFGKNYIETVEHLFYDCVHVKELWVKIEEWMLNKFNISVCFDKISVLFGKYTNRNIYRLQNLLILSVKQYIFASKYKQTTTPSLYFGCLEKTIIDRLYIEKYLLLKDCKYNEYEKHWQDICNKV